MKTFNLFYGLFCFSLAAENRGLPSGFLLQHFFAESGGFEPSGPFRVHTLSRRAP